MKKKADFDLVAANLLLPMLAMLVGKEDKGTGKLKLAMPEKGRTPEILKRKRRGDGKGNVPEKKVTPIARSKLAPGKA